MSSKDRSAIEPGTVLVLAPDVAQVVLPGPSGGGFALQFSYGECNVVFSEGGEFVRGLLEAVDGVRTWIQVIEELRDHFDGPETLWSEDVPQLVEDLLAWNVVRIVS